MMLKPISRDFWGQWVLRELVVLRRCGSNVKAKECDTGFPDTLMSGIEVLM